MFGGNVIFWALVGGIFPAILWLMFWLREDKKNPEPRRLILLAFFAGMLSVIFVLPFEMWAARYFKESIVLTFLIWAFFEETFKYIACRISVLKRREDDEPIDPMIYLITTALGFSALENAFFLFQPLLTNDIIGSIITANLRFIGASLLHVVTSATIGIFISLSFYKNRHQRKVFFLWGLFLAVILHASFNLFIMNNEGTGIFAVFFFVWIAIVGILALFEKVKRIRNINTY